MRRQMVCLCGSTRFCQLEYRDHDTGLTPWQEANYQLTLAGVMVLSIGVDTKSDAGLAVTPKQKVELDALHRDKIRTADAVVLVAPGGYIGDSTHGEIEHAKTARQTHLRQLGRLSGSSRESSCEDDEPFRPSWRQWWLDSHQTERQ